MRLNPVNVSTTAPSLLSRKGKPVALPQSAGAVSVCRQDEFRFCGSKPEAKKGETSEKKEEKAFLMLMASGAAGMVAGAVAGSAVPVIGTLIGSLLGGSIGFLIGASYKGGQQEPLKDDHKDKESLD